MGILSPVDEVGCICFHFFLRKKRRPHHQIGVVVSWFLSFVRFDRVCGGWHSSLSALARDSFRGPGVRMHDKANEFSARHVRSSCLRAATHQIFACFLLSSSVWLAAILAVIRSGNGEISDQSGMAKWPKRAKQTLLAVLPSNIPPCVTAGLQTFMSP